jgi:hypothetical protein
MIDRFFDKIIAKYHKFFTWQNDVICQECGKKIGVRIEDSLIVKDSASVMHKFTKDLVVI